MTLDFLRSVMTEGIPVYYIRYHHIYTSSVKRIEADRDSTYITLDDGAAINTANFGKVAFWSKAEAEKALAFREVSG